MVKGEERLYETINILQNIFFCDSFVTYLGVCKDSRKEYSDISVYIYIYLVVWTMNRLQERVPLHVLVYLYI